MKSSGTSARRPFPSVTPSTGSNSSAREARYLRSSKGYSRTGAPLSCDARQAVPLLPATFTTRSGKFSWHSISGVTGTASISRHSVASSRPARMTMHDAGERIEARRRLHYLVRAGGRCRCDGDYRGRGRDRRRTQPPAAHARYRPVDVDTTAAHMAYIQFSLLPYPGHRGFWQRALTLNSGGIG